MKKIDALKQRFQPAFHENLRDMMNYAADTYKGDTAFIIKHKQKKEISYEYIPFEKFRDDVNGFGTAMLQKGWQGKRIAVIGKNRYEWMLGYFASQCGLGLCVPLDRGLPYEELESSLQRSRADVLIFDPDQLSIVDELKKKNSCNVTEFISMDPLEGYDDVRAMTESGFKALENGYEDYLSLPIDPMAVSLILFTSGTTSMAKAVQLSQHNLTSNVYAMLTCEDIRRGDISMAFLPYHHTFGAIAQLDMIASGVVTTYCDGLKYLQKNIVEYKVTIFVCVPLLVESIYKKIMATVKKQGMEKKVAFGLKLTKALLKIGIDVRRKVFKQILDQLGGNLRFVISGAAAIDPEALEGFINFGI
ncbi:MAG: AMP-binding protein, partial [Emergencia sp.]|nr:AMP-binding protein [Emergencia sp.]